MVAYKCATIIGLSLHMEGFQYLVQVLHKGTITPFELLLNSPVNLSHLLFLRCVLYIVTIAFLSVSTLYHFMFPRFHR